MKAIRKFLAIILVACTLMCSLICTASAQSPEGTSVGTCSFADPGFVRIDPFVDELGRTDWPSIEDAKDYYGEDRNYYSCSCFSGGLYFNYYYLFEDGSRMFFGVI